MGFERPILTKFGTSPIWYFLQLSVWYPLGSFLCKHADDHSVTPEACSSPHLPCRGLCVMEVWKLNGSICTMRWNFTAVWYLVLIDHLRIEPANKKPLSRIQIKHVILISIPSSKSEKNYSEMYLYFSWILFHLVFHLFISPYDLCMEMGIFHEKLNWKAPFWCGFLRCEIMRVSNNTNCHKIHLKYTLHD